MKEYTVETDILDQFPGLRKFLKDQTLHHFFIGLDAELTSCAVSVIADGSTPHYCGKQARDSIVSLVGFLVEEGHNVAVAQEACGFGYKFHRELQSAGAHSIVTAPEMLNGKRKTDKADSRKLSSDLYAYLQLGNKCALRPIRVPSQDEQQLRALHRERSQIITTRNQLAAQGRSLAVSFNVLDVPKKWYGSKKWPVWRAQLKAEGQHWLIERLETKVPFIRQFEEQISALEEQTLQGAFEKDQLEKINETQSDNTKETRCEVEIQTVKEYTEETMKQIPKGLGLPTFLNLNAEICDWHRFSNRGNVGSYIGSCPREYSSGPNQRLGSIDRMGNCAVRTMLVEAAWRMVRYQPGWRGLKKHGAVLGKGAKASKRDRRIAIIAVARLLAIDLWRLAIGKCSLEDLGFVSAR